MRNTRLMTACLALSLIGLSAFFGLASSGASAGVSAGSALPDTVTPLVVEVKKNKSHSHHSHSNNKNRNKNWSHRSGKKYYVKRWNRRPHYGSVVAGVALGTILGVAAAGVAPAPRGDLCWYWTDAAMRSGYWDYCD